MLAQIGLPQVVSVLERAQIVEILSVLGHSEIAYIGRCRSDAHYAVLNIVEIDDYILRAFRILVLI